MMQPTDPAARQAFEVMVKQVLSAVADDATATALARDAKARGPDVAIASLLTQSSSHVQQAMRASGVQLPPQLLVTALTGVAMVLAAMLVQAGIGTDPQQIVRGAAQRIAQATGAAPGGQEAGGAPDDTAQGDDEEAEGEGQQGVLQRRQASELPGPRAPQTGAPPFQQPRQPVPRASGVLVGA